MKKFKKSRVLLAAAAFLILQTASLSAEEKAVESVQEMAAAAEAETAVLDSLDAGDLAQIKSLVEKIASAEKFSGFTEYGYDVLQTSGQMIEFGGTRKFIYHQPDNLRFEDVDRDGTRSLVTYDGKKLIFATTNENVYAMIDLPGDIETAMTFLQNEFNMATPLSDFLETAYGDAGSAAVTSDLISSANAGKSTIRGVVCDHLAFRTAEVDFQLWVSADEDAQVQVQRYVITYVNEPGKPQFWANISDWNMADTTPEADFTYKPSAEMTQIPLIRLDAEEEDDLEDENTGMADLDDTGKTPETDAEGEKP